jgi:hypothetical protein
VRRFGSCWGIPLGRAAAHPRLALAAQRQLRQRAETRPQPRRADDRIEPRRGATRGARPRKRSLGGRSGFVRVRSRAGRVRRSWPVEAEDRLAGRGGSLALRPRCHRSKVVTWTSIFGSSRPALLAVGRDEDQLLRGADQTTSHGNLDARHRSARHLIGRAPCYLGAGLGLQPSRGLVPRTMRSRLVRSRTASAACRAVMIPADCSTLAIVSWPRGDPRPARTPNAATNRPSASTSPSSSDRHRQIPLRDDDRATSGVSSGTSGHGRGCIDMTTPSCGRTSGRATARRS